MRKVNNLMSNITLPVFIRRSLSLVVVLAALVAVTGAVYSNNVFDEISDSVVRFHVIANSDSAEDQALKLKVRDAVIEYTKEITYNCTSQQEVLYTVSDNSAEIEKVARECLANEGSDYSTEVCVGEYFFPAKSYGSYSFPSGEYQALRIVIGEGKGQNWWCVLFPPLCYVSSGAVEVNTEDELLREHLSDEAYSVVDGSENKSTEENTVSDSAGVDSANVTVKFKIVEIFQRMESFIKDLFL